jgi:hypothetical protein
MGASTQNVDALLQDYLHRTERFRRFAWLFTGIPLALFIVLSVLAASKAKEYLRLSQESEKLKATIEQQITTLQQLQVKNDVQQLAIKFVQQQSPGARPKVVVYRLAVAGQVTDALKTLGYDVEQRLQQANPALAAKPVDTLSYGCGVHDQDIRTVATALTNAGIPIRRIVSAERNPDPNLIQVISSGITAETQNPLSISEISTWTRPSRPCQGNGPLDTRGGLCPAPRCVPHYGFQPMRGLSPESRTLGLGVSIPTSTFGSPIL